MTATDPTEAEADGGAPHPASVDEAPVFSTQEHLDYLLGLIIKEWKKTMVKWDDAFANMANATNNDELQIYRPHLNSVIKFRVDKVPEAIHNKVNALQHMQRIGLTHLPDLVRMAKEELAKDPFADNPDESSDDDQLGFTDLLMELAKGRIHAEYFEKEDTGFNLTVVFLDAFGEMRVKQCHLQHDTDFASFLSTLDDFPQEFNLKVKWAASTWEKKIQEIKEKGFDEHPKLLEVERLVAKHKATNYDDGPKWMFFKTNQRISYAKSIENEDDFKKILDIVTNVEKNSRLACVVRTVDKDLIFIRDELKFFEPNLPESEAPNDQAASPHTRANTCDQQPDEEGVPGSVSFTSQNCSFGFSARIHGAPFSFAFLRDGDDEDEEGEEEGEEEEEDKQLPWSLAKSTGKSEEVHPELQIA